MVDQCAKCNWGIKIIIGDKISIQTGTVLTYGDQKIFAGLKAKILSLSKLEVAIKPVIQPIFHGEKLVAHYTSIMSWKCLETILHKILFENNNEKDALTKKLHGIDMLIKTHTHYLNAGYIDNQTKELMSKHLSKLQEARSLYHDYYIKVYDEK
jgi:hypothetical protein